MLKRGIGIGLLCVAGHAYCDSIYVTTTADEVKDDNLCSLREAIEYVNQGMPEAGYKGCGGKDATAIIFLEKDKTYTLDKQIQIKKGLQIKTTYETDIGDNQLGMNNATIKMAGNDRIFWVSDENAENSQIEVGLIEVNLEGNPASKVNNGGLILNQEILGLQYVRLKNGHATVGGGAIYNVGLNADKTAGYVTIINAELQNNTAPQGAVIYSELPRFSISQSVLRDNKVTGTAVDASLLYSATAFKDDSTSDNASYRIYGLKNSTIFNNTGYTANVRDGMIINNVTLIKNSAGLYLNGPNGDAYISNSIIAKNGTSKDCIFANGDKSKLQNNLTDTGSADCRSGTAIDPNVDIGNSVLLAGDIEGKCDVASSGLLCPYYVPEKQFLGYFKPRLLMSYKTLADSLIVNRGRVLSNGENLSLASCEANDQRDKTRSSKELCDIGAIELVIDTDSISSVGQDILYGQTAKFSIADQLADGELVPASECESLLGKREDGKAWQAGCLRIVQTNTPSKGTLTLDQDGNVTYVPDGNWHGSDEFNLRIMTTLTRFSDSLNRYIEIPGKIVQDPPNDFESKKVKTSGGSLGIGVFVALLGLIGLRRFKKQG